MALKQWIDISKLLQMRSFHVTFERIGCQKFLSNQIWVFYRLFLTKLYHLTHCSTADQTGIDGDWISAGLWRSRHIDKSTDGTCEQLTSGLLQENNTISYFHFHYHQTFRLSWLIFEMKVFSYDCETCSKPRSCINCIWSPLSHISLEILALRISASCSVIIESHPFLYIYALFKIFLS